MIETIKIIVLSVICGVTSLLPTSSLGHFALINEVFGDTEKTFNSSFYYALFTLATGIAMYLYYFGIHTKIVKNIFRKKASLTSEADKAYKKAGRNLVLSLIPLLVLFVPIGENGFVGSLGKYFLSSDSLIFVGVSSIFCAILMFISIWYLGRDYAEKQNLLSAGNSFLFGLYQLPAYIFPGLSHISIGASRTSVSDIGLKNVLKETYLYLAPAFIIAGISRAIFYYNSGEGLNIVAAAVGFVICLFLALIMLSFINRYFSKRTFKAFTIYTLVFGIIITGTSLFSMLF